MKTIRNIIAFSILIVSTLLCNAQVTPDNKFVTDTSANNSPQHFTSSDTTPDNLEVVFYLDKDSLWELPNPNYDRKQQTIHHFAYTVSFNPEWHIPNWVAYELEAKETEGECERKSSFKIDPQVISGSANHKDYTNSGYDRGHMAPAADMRWNEQAMAESFYTSNICPQIRSLNAGDWKSLETQCRDWARQYGSIYIACGPIVAGEYKTIGLNKVAVPEAFFKVIFRCENDNYYGIGFLFEHKSQKQSLSFYAMSIDEIEEITGLNFFYALPDSIENVMEKQCTMEHWK